MRRENNGGQIDIWRAVIVAVLIVEIILMCAGCVALIAFLLYWLF